MTRDEFYERCKPIMNGLEFLDLRYQFIARKDYCLFETFYHPFKTWDERIYNDDPDISKKLEELLIKIDEMLK